MMHIALKSARKIYELTHPGASSFGRNWRMFPNKSYSSDLLRGILCRDKPAMVARLGSTELLCMVNYLGVRYPEKYKNYRLFIMGKSPPWWWNKQTMRQMQAYSGFFPAQVTMLEKFCELMIAELSQVDILGSWLKEESFFRDELSAAKKIMLEDLEPFFTTNPWTTVLQDKRVLVVHPFAKSIQSQYQKRDKLFDNGLLPIFQLEVLPAVQSLGGTNSDFNDWFQALDYMRDKIAAKQFDVCIIGCGAYGFPLAAFVKRMGKMAIHLGGVTQLLFGIKGARWEEYNYYPYANLFNEHWIRPSPAEVTESLLRVEGGCYI